MTRVTEPTVPDRDGHRARRPARQLSVAAVERFGVRLVLVSAAVALIAVPFTALAVQVLVEGPLTRFDGDIADSLNEFVHEHDGFIGFLQAVSWMGRPPALAALVIVAVVVLWRQGQVRLIPFVVLTPLLGSLVNSAVKITVDRPRPEVDHPIATAFGKSFPSGHSFSSVVTYGVLLVAFLPVVRPAWRRLVWVPTAVLVAAIGATRMLLGVHFLSDVIAGYTLGLAFLLTAIATFQTWKRAERARADGDEAAAPVTAPSGSPSGARSGP
jgi:undecaprenyl-diphosphatase